ncbi:pyridoxal kinase [Liquorilactobacillus aquaticus DSM 21051]|uniref:pyridoxal kinase n=1 Tax=Liquorilactobacillus aquaticus DSM 21051 TaxID=1423725 RepID=A0A0R2D9J8_9LACO|nr:bifunctional hydroxymethylpyrimidine kinase/phosphomethylpyrimidine kinase [Liquorilactobacillus aquaticus]KRM96755.1 pyridoxal kinase [Liquorilactobacillus aquaticus DSM 21051]
MENFSKSGRLMVAEDISAIGDLSMTAALPLLQAQGIPTALLPTSILSTQSEGFGKPVSLSVSQWLPRVLQHWEQQQIEIGGALIGYIADFQVGKEMVSFLSRNKFSFVYIDPVFADEGKIYPTLSVAQLAITRQLIKQADVITPNYTEALFLAGIKDEASSKKAEIPTEFELLKRLEDLMPKRGRAIITGVEDADKIGCIWLDEDERIMKRMFPRLKGHFYGSGDIFAALLAGFLWNGQPLSDAVGEAVFLTYQALKDTADSKRERRYGIDISRVIHELVQKKY